MSRKTELMERFDIVNPENICDCGRYKSKHYDWCHVCEDESRKKIHEAKKEEKWESVPEEQRRVPYADRKEPCPYCEHGLKDKRAIRCLECWKEEASKRFTGQKRGGCHTGNAHKE